MRTLQPTPLGLLVLALLLGAAGRQVRGIRGPRAERERAHSRAQSHASHGGCENATYSAHYAQRACWAPNGLGWAPNDSGQRSNDECCLRTPAPDPSAQMTLNCYGSRQMADS